MEKNEKLIRYSMQLAYLHTLLSAKLITENEYSRIKKYFRKIIKCRLTSLLILNRVM